MLRLANMLVVKRESVTYSIKNFKLAQIILSMVMQTPEIAKNGVKRILESQNIYNSVFKVDYDKDAGKKAFLIDLI